MLIIERDSTVLITWMVVINQIIIKAAVSVFPVDENKVMLHVLLYEYIFILGCYLIV